MRVQDLSTAGSRGTASSGGMAGGGRAGGGTRARPLLRAAAPAAVFVAVRAVGLAVLTLMVRARDGSVLEELTSWDGLWLLDLARHGYTGLPAGHYDAAGRFTAETPYGFFPGYPYAVSVVGELGVEAVPAGLIVSLLGGIAAAYAIVRLTELTPGGTRRAGLVAVALFASAPMAVVLSMAYTEALFCALAAWTLVHLLEERWIAAAACCLPAGLVRPTAFALIVPVLLAACLAAWRGTDRWHRSTVTILLAPVGLVGYLLYVRMRTGSRDGWFGVQERGWGWTTDFGVGTVQWARSALTSAGSVFETVGVAVLLGSIVLLVVAVHARVPWPAVAYAAGVIAMVLATRGLMFTKARFLLPAMVVLVVPVALGLAGRRAGTVAAVLAGAALGSAWFGGYALTVWANAV